jgi:hypothetical protein
MLGYAQIRRKMKVTNTKPPVEIYDVLSLCELKGIELPEVVDDWWFQETVLNEVNKEKHE